MKHQILATLLGLLTFSNFAQLPHTCYVRDAKGEIRERNFDMQHMLLEISFDVTKGLVKGEVTHTFEPIQKKVDSIFLDGSDIDFKKITLDGNEVKHETSEDGVIIRFKKNLTWGNTHKLNIVYEATPKKGLYFVGWNHEPGKSGDPQCQIRNQIWTQGQGIDNRHWIPSFDNMNDKLITEIKINFDPAYRVLSNGVLLKEKINKDGTKQWHYKISNPHPLYLVMLGIGKYDVKTTQSESGVKIHSWYYPEWPEREEPTYAYTEEMMDWLEEEYAVDYPWTDYAQIPVQDFIYGAMENTTATIFGDFYHMDERAYLDRWYVSTNAHELVHQWFGDYVTGISGNQIWLQESFATHYQKHFEKHQFGEDHFQENRRRELQRVLDAAKKDRNPIVYTKAGSARIYPKGSLVLDMLRYLLGDEQYRKVVTHYLKKFPYGSVSTHDFHLAFFEVLGMELKWFFDDWLHRGGEPHYKVQWSQELIEGSKSTRIDVWQEHKLDDMVDLFRMPIVFEVHYTDGSFDSKKVLIENQHHFVQIQGPSDKEVAFVLFDPDYKIIKTVEFERSTEELIAQAKRAPNMIDRFDALVALRETKTDKKRKALISIFNKETFHMTKSEIVKQLVNDENEDSHNLIRKALIDEDAHVRRAVIENVKEIPEGLVTDYEQLLSDPSYNAVEMALKKLSHQYPENVERYLDLTKNVFGVGNKVRIVWLEIGCSMDRMFFLPELVAMTGSGYEFRTRGYAFEALKRLNYVDQKVIKNGFDAMLHFNGRVSNIAAKVMRYFNEQTETKQKVATYLATGDWEDWERKRLKAKLKL